MRQKMQITPTLEFYRGQSRRLGIRQEKMSSHHSGVWEINIDLQSELLTKEDLRDIKLMSLEVIFFLLLCLITTILLFTFPVLG